MIHWSVVALMCVGFFLLGLYWQHLRWSDASRLTLIREKMAEAIEEHEIAPGKIGRDDAGWSRFAAEVRDGRHDRGFCADAMRRVAREFS